MNNNNIAIDAKKRNTIDQIFNALKYVMDPELNINIVDLGLVYRIEIKDDNSAKIYVTLTSPVCPLSAEIEEEIVVRALEFVPKVKVKWVFDPPWDKSMISVQGKELLDAYGY
jgi:metal-sulfur cluster biosynthetic enzyme